MNPDENLTADELAQFDAMRTSDQPDASPVESAVPETPAPPASATPEADTPAEPAKPEEPKRPQMVPHSALHEERERRKDTEKQLQEERRRFNLAWEKLNAPGQSQQPAVPEIPDFATDPAGNLIGTQRHLTMTVEQLAQAVKDQQEQVRQQQVIANLEQIGSVSAQRFKAEMPDYDAAVSHMLRVKDKQLELDGYSPLERRQHLKMEELRFIQRHGEDAAGKAYELAKTYGYSPAPVAQETPAAPAETDVTEKIARVEAGQQQARSLGAARGSSPSGVPPAERISKMSPAEFDAFMTKAEKDGTLRDFMGA